MLGASVMQNKPASTDQKAIADEFDEYHDKYSETINDSLSFSGMKVDLFVRAKAEHIVSLAEKHFSKPSKDLSFLDVGCGVGQYQSLLEGRSGRNVGIDVSQASIDRAASQNPKAEYNHYDGQRMPFEDATFDVVFAVCVMHHVPVDMWDHFVREMYRVTKPGGLCLLLEHSTIHPLTRYVVNNCPFDADAVLVKRAVAREVFSKAGFEDVKSKSILTIPAVDGVAKSIDLSLGFLPFGTQYCLSAVRP